LIFFGGSGKIFGSGKPDLSTKGTLWQIGNGIQTVENDRALLLSAKRTKQYAQSCLSMYQEISNAFAVRLTNEQSTEQRRNKNKEKAQKSFTKQLKLSR